MEQQQKGSGQQQHQSSEGDMLTQKLETRTRSTKDRGVKKPIVGDSDQCPPSVSNTSRIDEFMCRPWTRQPKTKIPQRKEMDKVGFGQSSQWRKRFS